MPTCQNCGYEWSWQVTFKKMLSFRMKMICPTCKKEQYQSAKTRKRSSLLSLPTLMCILLVSFNVSFALIIGLIIATSVLRLLITPFIVELSNEEEPLW